MKILSKIKLHNFVKVLIIGVLFIVICTHLIQSKLMGYTLIVKNESNETISYIGFVTNSIMDEDKIDFSDYEGGTENITGHFVGEELEFQAAIV